MRWIHLPIYCKGHRVTYSPKSDKMTHKPLSITASQKLVVASGNAHKCIEIEKVLQEAGLPISVTTASEFGGMRGCRETAPDFMGNARIKAEHLLSRVPSNIWILSDDSGLEVDLLGGQPGVFSARYAGEGATDGENCQKLLRMLCPYSQLKERKARFVCVLYLLSPHGEGQFFQGVCEGIILKEPKGDSGFGYDPLFQPVGFSKSFAQLPSKTKNQISHRAKALQNLILALTPK